MVYNEPPFIWNVFFQDGSKPADMDAKALAVLRNEWA